MSRLVSKKKKSFLQKAKKFGKKGNFGRGRQLSEEDYNFFIRIFQHLRDPEFQEKDLVLRSFFRSLEENKIKIFVMNQIVSRILDDALPLAPADNVVAIMKVLSEDLRIYCTDPFASHTIQTLLTLGLKYIQKKSYTEKKNAETSDIEKTKITKEQKEAFKSFLFKVSKFVYNNLNEYVCETYASHIIRTIFEICSGVVVSDFVKSSNKVQIIHSIKGDPKQVLVVPDQLAELLKDYIVRLTQLPQFVDVMCSDCGSAVLQSALLVLISLDNKDQLEMLVDHITKHGFGSLPSVGNSDTGIHPLFEQNSTSRLMEVVLQAASVEQQEILFQKFFEGKFTEMVRHNFGNFVMQKLLLSWKHKESFATLYDALAPCLEEAVQIGNTGVVFGLVQTCQKLSTHQSRCLKLIMSVLQCQLSESSQLQFVSCLLHMIPLPRYEQKRKEGEELSVSLHGALIIQELLRFNKPIKVVNSILNMNLGDLQRLACDPRGSHIIDAFADSPFVGEKSRDKLIIKFQGSLASLACNKHGSRSIEALWRVANVKTKTIICTELCGSSEKLQNSSFGKIIFNNFQVSLFKKKDKSDWQELQEKLQKKRKLLKDFLTDEAETSTMPKVKRKRDVEEEASSFVLDYKGEPVT